MRIAQLVRVATTALTFSLLIAASLAALHPAAAQTEEHQNIVKDLNATVRLGAYLPQNARLKSNVGDNIVCGGADFVVQRASTVERSIVSIDYISKTSGDTKLQLIPVTFGQVTANQNADLSKTNVYYGYGLGLYFAQINVPDITGTIQQTNKTLYGGYLNVGLNISRKFCVDARYHITSTSGPSNPGGLELTVGANF